MYEISNIMISGATAFNEAHFGQGSGLIGLTSLQCSGNESSLFRCISRNHCFHVEDAGVRCQNNSKQILQHNQYKI